MKKYIIATVLISSSIQSLFPTFASEPEKPSGQDIQSSQESDEYHNPWGETEDQDENQSTPEYENGYIYNEREITDFNDLVLELNTEYDQVEKNEGYATEEYYYGGEAHALVDIAFNAILGMSWRSSTDEAIQDSISTRRIYIDKMSDYITTLPEGDKKRFFSEAKDTIKIVVGQE